MPEPLPPPLPEPAPPMHSWRLWAGIVAANAAMGAIYLAAFFVVAHGPNYFSVSLAWPSFLLTPMLAGLVAAWVWRGLNLSLGKVALASLYITLLALVAAAVVMREGAICLLIVSPLLYGCLLAGASVGRVWFKPFDGSHLRLSVAPLLVVAIFAELFTRGAQSRVAVDQLLIHAPPSRVWPEVTAFPTIPAPPRFWLFRLGLPYPQATTSAGNFVGADRRCLFSGGAIFKEAVAEIVPQEKLTFDILESPPDPELLGHLTPSRGQFFLRDNHDGTTTLIGSTWYTLHVRPLWYFDAWTQYIFRAVHLRVMEDVRRRAEAAPTRG